MTNEAIEIRSVEEAVVKRDELLDRVKEIIVRDNDSLEIANSLIIKLTAAEKAAIAFFEPMKKSTYAAWKEVCSRENEVVDPIRAGKTHVAKQAGTYVYEMEEKRRAEEDRLRREQAEEERRKREETEKLRRKAEEEARRRAEEEQIKAAEKAREERGPEAADEVLSAPVEEFVSTEDAVHLAGLSAETETPSFVPPPTLPSVTEKLKGISVPKNWKFEVFDLRALARAVLDGKAPISAIQANEKFIGAEVRNRKEHFSMSGVRTWAEAKARATGR